MTEEHVAKRQDADSEFIEWVRGRYERIAFEQLRQAPSSDVLDQTYFSLNDDEFERLNGFLDNPPPAPEGLREFMARKAPWE